MRTDEEVEHEDRWLLGWRGLHVHQANESATETVLAIGDRSTLICRTPSEVTVRPISNQTSESASVADLVGDQVISSVAFKTGGIRIVFRSGLRLDITSKNSSWEAVGNSGRTWTGDSAGLASTAPTEP